MWKRGDEIFGLYRIDRVLSNGLEHIYAAEHIKSQVKVAIRRPGSDAAPQSYLSRFVEQAKIWMDLGRHPNIASCYFIHFIDQVPHLFVEYADGGDLRQWIENARCADLKTGIDLAIQFCRGMAHIHSRGIIHRDIKPANVLMTQDGLLKIGDFFLAMKDHHQASASDAQRGPDEGSGFSGTVPYASPEQFETPHLLGPESDLYSFGICLWEMILGRLPRENALKVATLLDPLSLRPDLPKDLAQLLSQLVNLDAGVRATIGGSKALQERLCTIYQRLFGESWVDRFVPRLPVESETVLPFWRLADELGADLAAPWLKPGNYDLPGEALAKPVTVHTESQEQQIPDEEPCHPFESEIKGVVKSIDLSRYCFSPIENKLAYLVDRHWDHHHGEPVTYVGAPFGRDPTYGTAGENIYWWCTYCGLAGPWKGSTENQAALSVIRTTGEIFGSWIPPGFSRGILSDISPDSKSLRWSPDGTLLSLISHSGKRLFIVSLDKRSATMIPAGEDCFTDHFWSPSSRFVAISGFRESDGQQRHFVLITDDRGSIKNTYWYNKEFHWPGWVGVDAGFAWSPTDDEYAVGDNCGFRIFHPDGRPIDEFLDKEARQGTMVVEWPARDIMVTMSYDTGIAFLPTDKVVCTTKEGGHGRSMNVFHHCGVAASLWRLTGSKPFAVSPDGRKLMYLREQDGPRNLRRYELVMAEGGGEHIWKSAGVVGNDGWVSHQLAWSPDGQYVVISSSPLPGALKPESLQDEPKEFATRPGIWVLNVDDSNIKWLTDGWNASWSHDNSVIAFTRTRENGQSRLFLLDFNSWLTRV